LAAATVIRNSQDRSATIAAVEAPKKKPSAKKAKKRLPRQILGFFLLDHSP
jgi:hypothetical protein